MDADEMRSKWQAAQRQKRTEEEARKAASDRARNLKAALYASS
jgi:hypothetical protein